VTPDEYLSRIDLVRSETGRVSKVWRGLTEAQWKTPTFCPGWEAEHVVSHVATGADFYGNSVCRALEGLPPEPPYGSDAKEFHGRILFGKATNFYSIEKTLAKGGRIAEVMVSGDQEQPELKSGLPMFVVDPQTKEVSTAAADAPLAPKPGQVLLTLVPQ